MQPVNSRRDKALRYAVQWGCCRGDKRSFWQQMWLIMWPSMLSKHCIWWSRTGATPLAHGHSYGTHHANKHAQGKWVHIWWVHCCIRQLHTIVLVQLCFHRPSTKKHTHTLSTFIYYTPSTQTLNIWCSVTCELSASAALGQTLTILIHTQCEMYWLCCAC